MDDYASGDIPCDLSGTHRSKYIWLDLNSSVAIVCVILMTIWIVDIYLHFRKAENVARELSFLKIMRLYPLALLITWLPRSILRFLISVTLLSANSSSRIVAGTCLEFLSTQYGTLAAIIYFSHSSASRKLWVIEVPLKWSFPKINSWPAMIILKMRWWYEQWRTVRPWWEDECHYSVSRVVADCKSSIPLWF